MISTKRREYWESQWNEAESLGKNNSFHRVSVIKPLDRAMHLLLAYAKCNYTQSIITFRPSDQPMQPNFFRFPFGRNHVATIQDLLGKYLNNRYNNPDSILFSEILNTLLSLKASGQLSQDGDLYSIVGVIQSNYKNYTPIPQSVICQFRQDAIFRKVSTYLDEHGFNVRNLNSALHKMYTADRSRFQTENNLGFVIACYAVLLGYSVEEIRENHLEAIMLGDFISVSGRELILDDEQGFSLALIQTGLPVADAEVIDNHIPVATAVAVGLASHGQPES